MRISFRALLGASILFLGFSGPAAFASPGPVLLPAVVTVHIKDFQYRPTPTTIHVGERVTFINDDDEAHTVTSTDKTFDSEGLDTGNSWQHVFTKPGTFSYFCELHPYMKATIIVLPAKETSGSSGEGSKK
ncbi:MAG TPA: cupredoxin family copper-binding protein [Candidatus Baltobacteraceae bacterium]|jgi:plastocyanin|nr:cupredoxin family copper-binding protein [Candidatus Baltobacteraceae bacterium]